MKPDDRIRVLAPVGGQVLAFAAVLLLGLAFGHRSGSPHPPPTPPATNSKSPTTSPPAPGPGIKLKVTASKSATGAPVAVLNAGTSHRLRLGKIGRDGQYSVKLPPGTYLICLNVPKGYKVGSAKAPVTGGPPSPGALPAGAKGGSWMCMNASVSSAARGMTFKLAKSASQGHPTPGNSGSAPSRSGSPSPTASTSSVSVSELAP